MSSKLLVIGIIGIVLVAAVWFFFLSQGAEKESIGSEETALAKCIEDPIPFGEYDANTIASQIGKPVVANSWAGWCPFCINELPDFAQLQEEFGDEVVFLAVNRAETAGQAQKFICELELRDNLTYLLDPRDKFYAGIGGFSMPETIFVDREGVTQFHKRGVMNLEEIRRRTQELL
jgi:thiol-disulfide isomerase/thioredoxin